MEKGTCSDMELQFEDVFARLGTSRQSHILGRLECCECDLNRLDDELAGISGITDKQDKQ